MADYASLQQLADEQAAIYRRDHPGVGVESVKLTVDGGVVTIPV